MTIQGVILTGEGSILTFGRFHKHVFLPNNPIKSLISHLNFDVWASSSMTKKTLISVLFVLLLNAQQVRDSINDCSIVTFPKWMGEFQKSIYIDFCDGFFNGFFIRLKNTPTCASQFSLHMTPMIFLLYTMK